MVYNVMKEIDIIISHIVTNDTTVSVLCCIHDKLYTDLIHQQVTWSK